MHADADPEALAAECRTFVRYLLSHDAPAPVVDAYVRAHAVSRIAVSGCSASVDRALIALARRGPFWTRAADAYAALFARAGLLRRKLVLLVAILESHGPSSREIDTARPGSRLLWVVETGARAVLSLVLLLVAAVIIAPSRMFGRQ